MAFFPRLRELRRHAAAERPRAATWAEAALAADGGNAHRVKSNFLPAKFAASVYACPVHKRRREPFFGPRKTFLVLLGFLVGYLVVFAAFRYFAP